MSGSNADKLESFRAALGGDHVALPCNLSDGAAVDQLVPQAVEALGGKLDILVNNAGVTRDNLADADEGRGVRTRSSGSTSRPRSG